MPNVTQVDQRTGAQPKGQQLIPSEDAILDRLDLILRELRQLNLMFQLAFKVEGDYKDAVMR